MAFSPTPNLSALTFPNPSLPKRPPLSPPPPSSSSPSVLHPKAIAKELRSNHDGSAIQKLQKGVNLVADLVGVTLGPKGRNMVLQNKYGRPKIVNDGETVLNEIELETH